MWTLVIIICLFGKIERYWFVQRARELYIVSVGSITNARGTRGYRWLGGIGVLTIFCCWLEYSLACWCDKKWLRILWNTLWYVCLVCEMRFLWIRFVLNVTNAGWRVHRFSFQGKPRSSVFLGRREGRGVVASGCHRVQCPCHLLLDSH